jgi:hypothetical protein
MNNIHRYINVNTNAAMHDLRYRANIYKKIKWLKMSNTLDSIGISKIEYVYKIITYH